MTGCRICYLFRPSAIPLLAVGLFAAVRFTPPRGQGNCNLTFQENECFSEFVEIFLDDLECGW